MENQKTTTMLITPEIARRFLKNNKSNRALSPKNIAYFLYQMLSGQFILSPQGIAFDIYGRLIDGQHRLHALIKSGKSFYFNVTTGCSPDVFKILDTGKNRSAGDVLSIEGVKNYNNIAAGIKKHLLLSKGSKNTSGNAHEHKITNVDILNQYSKHADLYQLTHAKCSALYHKLRIMSLSHMTGYTAFLHIDKKHDFDKVIEFFSQIVTYSENGTVNLFRERQIKNKVRRITEPLSVTQALLAKTWNAYLLGRSYKTLRFNQDEQFPEFM